MNLLEIYESVKGEISDDYVEVNLYANCVEVVIDKDDYLSEEYTHIYHDIQMAIDVEEATPEVLEFYNNEDGEEILTSIVIYPHKPGFRVNTNGQYEAIKEQSL